MPREKAKWELHKDVAYCFEHIPEAAIYRTEVVQPLTTNLENHQSNSSKICRALLEKDDLIRDFPNELLHMDTPVVINQQRLTFINSVPTLDAIKRIYQEKWSIGTDGENESRESMLLLCHKKEEDTYSTIRAPFLQKE